eukprot:1597011-Rhodomonas_salina.2
MAQFSFFVDPPSQFLQQPRPRKHQSALYTIFEDFESVNYKRKRDCHETDTRESPSTPRKCKRDCMEADAQDCEQALYIAKRRLTKEMVQMREMDALLMELSMRPEV